MTGLSAAWALATMAMAHVLDQRPLPKGIVEARVGEWELTLNNSKEMDDELGAMEVRAAHQVVIGFGILAPTGGMIGGYSEEAFIEDMKAVIPEAEWREVLA